jgi:hypothetical protein
MRLFIYILLIVTSCMFLGSCGLFMSCTNHNIQDNYNVDTISSIVGSGPVLDTAVFSYEKIVLEERNVSAIERVSELEPIKEKSIYESTSNEIIEEMDIVDNTDIDKINDKDYANIAYNIPDDFKVNEFSTIKLRISKNKNIEAVVIGDREIPIVSEESNDKVVVETILVDDKMSATLYGDEEIFDIKLTSNKVQNIYEKGYTEWVWRVKPLKSGKHYIKLIITVADRDLVVYEKDIPVQGNLIYSFASWVVKCWEPIVATVITPILIPLFLWYRKKKKNKKSKD